MDFPGRLHFAGLRIAQRFYAGSNRAIRFSALKRTAEMQTEPRFLRTSNPAQEVNYRDISTALADSGLPTGTTAGSAPIGSTSSGTGEREWLRIGLPTSTHKASQIVPKIIAASTSVRKCAPNAMR